MKSSSIIRHVLLLLGLYFCSLALSGPLHAGTAKVATNLGGTHYFQQQNAFANILLNFTGFGWRPGGDLTDDCVSKRGAEIFFNYHPDAHPGMWPDSTDDPATWYKLSYHCETDKNSVTVGGFTVAKPPVKDGQGNWTGRLSFKESDVKKNQRVSLRLNYAKEDLDEKGLAKHPLSRLRILLPGCSDNDFLSPVFKQRLTGFCRLRFCDTLYMNGRRVACGVDVPGTQNTYEKEGKTILRAVNSPANVQTQTYVKGWIMNMSWGQGVGKGNHMFLWDAKAKKFNEAVVGIGCLAPCELEYDLDGRFLLFSATVGIDHEVDGDRTDPHGDVTFQVWAAESPPLTRPSPPWGEGRVRGPDDWKLLQEVKKLSTQAPAGILVDVTGKAKLKLKMINNAGGDDTTGHVDILSPSVFFIQRWTDRTVPTLCCGSSGPNWSVRFREGMPYEFAIRMCNELSADMWINMPCTADDDYIHNLANLVLYGSDQSGKVYTPADGPNPRPARPPAGWHPPLDKSRSLWVENDNEVWNWGYECFGYYQTKGRFNKRSTYEQYGVDLKRMSDILKPHFAAAGRAGTLKIVFANQTTGGWGDHNTDEVLTYMEKNYGPVNGYFDYYAEAPYSGTGEAFKRKPKTLDEVFEYSQDHFDRTINHVIPEMARRAAKWKLGVTTYEGGFHWEGGPMDMIRQGRANRRTGMLYDQYLQAWQAAAGPNAIYQEYSMFSNYEGDAWPFLAIQYCGPGMKGSITYDALVRNSHPAGDADLDGSVTYEDLKILAANFGGDGEKDRRWWSQGDFNNDQVVGLDDLKLLLTNTDSSKWTPEQQKDLKTILDAHPGPYVLGPDPKTRQGTWTLLTWRNHTKSISIPAQEDSGGVPSRHVVGTAPRHGKLDVSTYPTITYTPDKDYLGSDDFVIAVKDDKDVASNPVWVAAEVNVAADRDLIANCHCDENTGTRLTDTGGNVGELVNTVTWTAGKSGSGLAFTWKEGDKFPVPGFVKLQNAPARDGTAYTLSVWVRPDEIPTAKSTGGSVQNLRAAAGLLGKPCEVNFGGLCFVADPKDGTKGRFAMRHVQWFSAAALEADSADAYAAGEWHHVVGVADPAAQDRNGGQPARAFGVVRLYVDGKLVGKSHFTGEGTVQSFLKFGNTGDKFYNSNFYLGAIQPGDDPKRDTSNCRGCFKGASDEVRIYKRALSDAEVADLYRGGLSMPPTVSISRPAANGSFSAGADITLQANANDVDGDVARVDYYLGSVAADKKLNAADIIAAPFTFVWKDVKPGIYTIFALASDDTGVTAQSRPFALTVK